MLLPIQGLVAALIGLCGFAAACRGRARASVLTAGSIAFTVLCTGWFALPLFLLAAGTWLTTIHGWRVGRWLVGTLLVAWLLWVKIGVARQGLIAAQPLLLPMGLSYFVLQMVAFLVEGATDKPSPDRTWDFVRFCTLAPVRMTGPVIRWKRTAGASSLALPTSRAAWTHGLTLILMGLAKKRLMADTVAQTLHGRNHTGLVSQGTVALLWVTTAFFDASGYSDIAQGCGRLLGISVPTCFASPLTRARTLSDFWRRWQVPLMGWFRDFVYRPVRSSWPGRRPARAALITSFAVSAIWHGVHYIWLVWGLVTIGLLVIEERSLNATRTWSGGLKRVEWVLRRAVVWAYLAVLLTLLRGRQAGAARTTGLLPESIGPLAPAQLAGVLALSAAALYASDRLSRAVVGRSLPQPFNVVLGAAIVLMLSAPGGMAPFVYQAF